MIWIWFEDCALSQCPPATKASRNLELARHGREKMRRILVLAVAMFLTSAVQAQKGKIFTAEDFTQNAPQCSQRTTSFIVQGGPKLPVYQIRLIEDPPTAATPPPSHVSAP